MKEQRYKPRQVKMGLQMIKYEDLYEEIMTAMSNLLKYIRNNEEILMNNLDIKLGAYWDVLIKYFVPLGAIILLFWWFLLSATTYTANESFDPFKPYSIMTCLFQWSIAFFLLNYFNQRLGKTAFRQDEE